MYFIARSNEHSFSCSTTWYNLKQLGNNQQLFLFQNGVVYGNWTNPQTVLLVESNEVSCTNIFEDVLFFQNIHHEMML